jgi:pyruvate,orthophosphate dikinase
MSVRVFDFDHPHTATQAELTQLLGGKGMGLAHMTRVLSLPVPPGFTIATTACRDAIDGRLPIEVEQEIAGAMRRLEVKVGRCFGSSRDPLLLSVRSGAPTSMPGMMDTVLNLGLNDDTARGLAEVTGDTAFAYDCYARFLRMYAEIVMGVPPEALSIEQPVHPGPTAMMEQAATLQQRITSVHGQGVPQHVEEQLHDAIAAVIRSWWSPRARVYRKRNAIPDDQGTAVNVQAMVFGNRNQASGTGVVFTRNPANGEATVYGDCLPCAQGEDVVSGSRATQPISFLRELLPDVFAELQQLLTRLERYYRDMCDVEFTIESGRLWILQTRIGKRTAAAAARIAVDLVDDPRIALTPAEAVLRLPASEMMNDGVDGRAHAQIPCLSRGLAASPGVAVGRICLDAAEAVERSEAGDAVILVTRETSPSDMHGICVAKGLLTATGGLVSHAAVVAREWGIPAVVGAHEMRFVPGGVLMGNRVLPSGACIAINGSTGEIFDRPIESQDSETPPQLSRLRQWCLEIIGCKADDGSSIADLVARAQQRLRGEAPCSRELLRNVLSTDGGRR